MKYLSLLPLAGLAIAAPGNWQDDPVKETTTSPAPASKTWEDAPVDPTTSATWEDVDDVTVTETATGTYCGKTGKLTKPAPAGGQCTIDVTTVTVATATVTVPGGGKGGPGGAPGACKETVTVTAPGGGNGSHGGNGGKETVTVTQTTTVGGGHGGNGGKETVTVTTTVGGKDTVTKTVTEDCSAPTGGHGGPGGNGGNGGNGGHGGPGGKCLSDEQAKKLVDNFSILLEYTSYDGSQGGPKGRGYKMDVSNATLATDFVDISDSINFMAGFPLGSVTFPNKAAFDFGQGVKQPEVKVDTLNIFHDCSSITWRWKITPPSQGTAYPVNGINYMIVNEDGLLSKNYAEFDNGAWLQSIKPTCAINPVSVKDGAPATK